MFKKGALMHAVGRKKNFDAGTKDDVISLAEG